jgi:hypothetical protein
MNEWKESRWLLVGYFVATFLRGVIYLAVIGGLIWMMAHHQQVFCKMKLDRLKDADFLGAVLEGIAILIPACIVISLLAFMAIVVRLVWWVWR